MQHDAASQLIEMEIDDLQQYSERLVDDIYHTKQLQDSIIRDIEATKKEIMNIKIHREKLRQARPSWLDSKKEIVPSIVPPLWSPGTQPPSNGTVVNEDLPAILSSSREVAEALKKRHEEWKKSLAEQLDRFKLRQVTNMKALDGNQLATDAASALVFDRIKSRLTTSEIFVGSEVKNVPSLPPRATSARSEFMSARSGFYSARSATSASPSFITID